MKRDPTLPPERDYRVELRDEMDSAVLRQLTYLAALWIDALEELEQRPTLEQFNRLVDTAYARAARKRR